MRDTHDNAWKFLTSLQRFDLAMLLKECEVAIVETEVDNGWFDDTVKEAVVWR
ncbi:hypothetical protein PY365_30710 [Roseiarcaceae bacterium H3SJ34-1]|uniref:hypothetical protein n=1 Tax=Terripilifer ovatus TaxID=3032367 RepID=UPI003AB92D05|nr:hypothetical protein [Roseiarcaceae bacterium H3SJ34-1]